LNVILFILIPEFIIGFIVAQQVIKNNHQEIVWQTINRGQPVSNKIHENVVITLLVLTLIGIFAALIYYIALKKHK
jgi:uncharacterized membrane protein YjgN (DUF898 family)